MCHASPTGAIERFQSTGSPRSSGRSGALAYDGKVTHTAGVANLESGRPMVGGQGRFRVAGNSKAFTAAAVRRLVADGRLRLGGRDVYPAGSRYGYGVASVPLSCGGVCWGHGGDLPGGSVGGGRATAGRGTVTVRTTTWAAEGESLRHLQGAMDAAL